MISDSPRHSWRHRMRGAGREALTLVEVMAATMVMALAIGSSIVGIQAGMNHLDVARTSTSMAQLLQQEAERLRLLNWAGIESLPSSETWTPKEGVPDTRRGKVKITRDVSSVAGYPDMKEIRLRATWEALNGRPCERVLWLRYAKGGLHDYYYNSTGN